MLEKICNLDVASGCGAVDSTLDRELGGHGFDPRPSLKNRIFLVLKEML